MFGVSAGPPTRFFHVFILDIEIPQILNFTFFAYGLGLGRRIWNGFESVCDHKHCWRNFLPCMNDWWIWKDFGSALHWMYDIAIG